MNPIRTVVRAFSRELGGRHRDGPGRSRELSANRGGRRRPSRLRCPACTAAVEPPLCPGCGLCAGCVARCGQCLDCVVLCQGHRGGADAGAAG